MLTSLKTSASLSVGSVIWCAGAVEIFYGAMEPKYLKCWVRIRKPSRQNNNMNTKIQG